MPVEAYRLVATPLTHTMFMPISPCHFAYYIADSVGLRGKKKPPEGGLLLSVYSAYLVLNSFIFVNLSSRNHPTRPSVINVKNRKLAHLAPSKSSSNAKSSMLWNIII